MTPPPAPPDPPFAAEPVPADVLAWAAQTLDAADVAEQVRQIDAGHGRPLAEVLADLRRQATGGE